MIAPVFQAVRADVQDEVGIAHLAQFGIRLGCWLHGELVLREAWNGNGNAHGDGLSGDAAGEDK